MAKKLAFLLVAMTLFVGGCVPPYQPPTTNKKQEPAVVVVEAVTPKAAFDAYTVDTANDFRALAQDCVDGKFEYVSELMDAAVALDKEAKTKRSKPIDTLIQTALGADELDKDKAAKVLMEIADNLDPAHKVELKYPQVTEPVVVPAKK